MEEWQSFRDTGCRDIFSLWGQTVAPTSKHKNKTPQCVFKKNKTKSLWHRNTLLKSTSDQVEPQHKFQCVPKLKLCLLASMRIHADTYVYSPIVNQVCFSPWTVKTRRPHVTWRDVCKHYWAPLVRFWFNCTAEDITDESWLDGELFLWVPIRAKSPTRMQTCVTSMLTIIAVGQLWKVVERTSS